jgi:hypothetical protein
VAQYSGTRILCTLSDTAVFFIDFSIVVSFNGCVEVDLLVFSWFPQLLAGNYYIAFP